MISAAVALGALPSLGGSFVCTAVGFVTEATGDATCYFKLLLAFFLTSGLAVCLGNLHDEAFDLKFSPRVTYRFRIYALGLALPMFMLGTGVLLPRLADADAGPSAVAAVCLAIAGLGFCCGGLVVAGAVVVGSLRRESHRSLLLTWLGVAAAGLACAAAQWATSFGPRSGDRQVEAFFGAGSALAALCIGVFAVLDWRDDLVPAIVREAEEEAASPLAVQRVDTGGRAAWNPFIQGGNQFLTAFLFPLLPLVRCRYFATILVSWKLFMDFLGPLAMLFWHGPCCFELVAGLAAARVLLVLVVLAFMLTGSTDMKLPLLAAWDAAMLIGSVLTCAMDAPIEGIPAALTPLAPRSPSTSPPGIERATSGVPRLRLTRLAHQLGITCGLLVAGGVLYALTTAEVTHVPSPACFGVASCAPASPRLAASQPWPCGGRGGAGGSGGEVRGSADTVRILQYGANMGCAKLTAIGVYPMSATPARARGLRLRFGDAEGFPTSGAEPAFAALVDCRGGGCVHGVVHELSRADVRRLAATEPGYRIEELPDVVGYDGQPLRGVSAFRAAKDLVEAAPSRRYAGLVLCQARHSLSASYGEQLMCELERHGFRNLNCSQEEFLPLAAERGHFLGALPLK